MLGKNLTHGSHKANFDRPCLISVRLLLFVKWLLNIFDTLTDNFGWGSAYVYAWDADGNAIGGEWPGAAQAETTTNGYGETQFICHVPEGAVGVILSNGNGAQTEDITDFTHAGYWMDGSKNDLGHFLVTAWD